MHEIRAFLVFGSVFSDKVFQVCRLNFFLDGLQACSLMSIPTELREVLLVRSLTLTLILTAPPPSFSSVTHSPGAPVQS